MGLIVGGKGRNFVNVSCGIIGNYWEKNGIVGNYLEKLGRVDCCQEVKLCARK